MWESTAGLKVRALGSPCLLHTSVLSIAGDPSIPSPAAGCSSAANRPALLADAMASPPQGAKTFLIR